MTTTLPLPALATAPRPRLATAAEVVVCAWPAMLLVALGQFTYAAYWLFLAQGLLLLRHLLNRRTLEAAALAVGCIPIAMLLRGFFFYSALQAVFLTILCSAWTNPTLIQRLRKNTPLGGFCLACFLYWAATFLRTGDYSANIRVLELGLVVPCVSLLAGRRSYLGGALLGIALAVVAMACGLLPYGARLGIVSVGAGLSIGNPIAMGLSSAIGCLLAIGDGGRWLQLHRRPWAGALVSLATGAVLVLSTSRGSWLVTLAGLAVILMLDRKGRIPLLQHLALLGAMTALLLTTERGPVIRHYFENAVADDRSLDKRTTGRADQWKSFPRVFDASPLWGFGPGSGKAVSLEYTKEGKPWHSLYLLVGVETGLLGLAALTLLIATLFGRALAHRAQCGESMPLVALVCFLTIGVSVSGLDAISGVFLGLAFAAGDCSGFRLVRFRPQAPQEVAVAVQP